MAKKIPTSKKVEVAEYYLKHDLTQPEVAEKFGVAASSVTRWVAEYKRGDIGPPLALPESNLVQLDKDTANNLADRLISRGFGNFRDPDEFVEDLVNAVFALMHDHDKQLARAKAWKDRVKTIEFMLKAEQESNESQIAVWNALVADLERKLQDADATEDAIVRAAEVQMADLAQALDDARKFIQNMLNWGLVTDGLSDYDIRKEES